MDREQTSRLYELFSQVGKSLSDPKRIELLEMLARGPHTVETLARETGLEFSHAARHLQILVEARLVECTRDGLCVIYRLAHDHVVHLLRSIRTVSEVRMPEIVQLRGRAFDETEGEILHMPPERLQRLLANHTFTLIDVRPLEEYRAGHLPGAVHISPDHLEEGLAKLPPEGEILAWCRGPYCFFAHEAVKRLRARGRHAWRLSESEQDWLRLVMHLVKGDEPDAPVDSEQAPGGGGASDQPERNSA